MALTVHPLDLGTLNVDKSGLTLRLGLGTRVDAPCIGYLIKGGESPILVDSGPCADPDWGTQHHNPFRRSPEQSLEYALAMHGLAPGDIRTVIITHLHWDHCYGNASLPYARFIVQRREIAYAIAPLPCDAPIYESQLHPIHFLGALERFDIIDGDCDIAPDVRCVLLPGHTPGLQGVLVKTQSGRVMIASDHCPLYENFDSLVPTGIIHDLEAWYASTARIKNLADRILPGHDIRALQPNQKLTCQTCSGTGESLHASKYGTARMSSDPVPHANPIHTVEGTSSPSRSTQEPPTKPGTR